MLLNANTLLLFSRVLFANTLLLFHKALATSKKVSAELRTASLNLKSIMSTHGINWRLISIDKSICSSYFRISSLLYWLCLSQTGLQGQIRALVWV